MSVDERNVELGHVYNVLADVVKKLDDVGWNAKRVAGVLCLHSIWSHQADVLGARVRFAAAEAERFREILTSVCDELHKSKQQLTGLPVYRPITDADCGRRVYLMRRDEFGRLTGDIKPAGILLEFIEELALVQVGCGAVNHVWYNTCDLVVLEESEKPEVISGEDDTDVIVQETCTDGAENAEKAAKTDQNV